MKRMLAACLATGGLVLLLAPFAVATGIDLEVSTDADLTLGTQTDLALPSTEVSLDGSSLLRFDAGTKTSLGTASAPDPAEYPASRPQTVKAPAAKDWVDPGTAATVATAAAGLALLGGLAASHWGSLKFGLVGLFLPLFSRIQPHRVLENDVRSRVHEAVTQNPGVTIKEITALCGIGWGTAVYHLKRLEAERLVVSERQRQFRRFYKNGGRIVNESKGAFGELKNPTGQRIARTILESPGRCQKELCASVGISAPLAHKYLARLEEAGLVAAQREWRTVKYFPTPKLEDLLLVASGEPALPPASALQAVPVAA